MALSLTEYPSFNDSHFTEKLLTAEEVRISRETVRSIRRRKGVLTKGRRRPRRHRSRRARKPEEGMVVLCHGSVHRGFGAQHSSCYLIAVIDKGTSRRLVADFSPLSLRRDIGGSIHAERRVDLSSVKEGYTVEIRVRKFPLFWCVAWKVWDLRGRGFAQSSG